MPIEKSISTHPFPRTGRPSKPPPTWPRFSSSLTQCHKSYAFLVWRKRYEEATAHRSSTKGQMKLLEYCPPSAEPGLWQKIMISDKSLLLFGPRNRIREFCRWLTSPTPITPSNPLNGEAKSATGSITRGALPGAAGSARANPSVRGNQGCWRRFLGREESHRLARATFQAVEVCAVVAILVVVSVDVELASGRRTAAGDKTSAKHRLETAAVCAFLAGALVQIVAQGLVLLPGAYLRSSSNILGLSLTALSTVCLWPFGDSERGGDLPLSAFKALRALNVLRLVRVAMLSCSLMDLLKALRSSGRALCLAGAVVLSFWIQWSIVGLQVHVLLRALLLAYHIPRKTEVDGCAPVFCPVFVYHSSAQRRELPNVGRTST